MKVRELIEALDDCDPDATVLIMSQPSWPFENSISDVVVREDVEDCDEDDAKGEGKQRERGTAANDVFLLEGEQLRYGSKAAWGAR